MMSGSWCGGCNVVVGKCWRAGTNPPSPVGVSRPVLPLQLPFQLEDASRRDLDAEEVKALEEKAAAEGGKGVLTITVSQDARLNCRWLDMRTKPRLLLCRHWIGPLGHIDVAQQDCSANPYPAA